MSANKHKLAWSKLRTDIDLITRNKVYSKRETTRLLLSLYEELDNHQNSMINSLEYKKIIYPPADLDTIKKVGFKENMSYEEKRLLMGINNNYVIEKDSPMDRLDKMLKKGSGSARKSSWFFRLGQACKEFINWHPFFVTLTVDPKIISPRDLWTDGETWQKYIKSIAKISMKCGGLTNKQRKKTSAREYIQYAALLEHGKSGNHDHIHCIMFIKHVPESWKIDPNLTMSTKTCVHRRCLPLESLWNYSAPGLSPALYFRYIGDIWTRYGHKIPISNGKALKLMPPESSGGYLLKYMDKSKERPFCHRIKATRSIGMKLLKDQIEKMNVEQMKQLMIRPPSQNLSIFLQKTLTVPSVLMKYVIKTTIYNRTYQKMSFRELIEPRPKPYLSMLRSVKSGANPWRYSSSQLYDWLTSVLPQEKIEFCEKNWLKSISCLSVFYKDNLLNTNTIGAV